MKSKKMRWTERVPCVVIWECRKIFWLEKPEEKTHLEELGMDEKIILIWMLGKHMWEFRLLCVKRPVEWFCGYGNEPLRQYYRLSWQALVCHIDSVSVWPYWLIYKLKMLINFPICCRRNMPGSELKTAHCLPLQCHSQLTIYSRDQLYSLLFVCWNFGVH
jgi:hypothetical protein